MKPVRLSRRALLKGAAGIAIALPTLEAMLDGRGLVRQAHANPAAPPLRLMTFYFPNGTVIKDWTPKAVGPGYELTKALLPLGGTATLAPIRDHVNVVSGLWKNEYKENATGVTAEAHLRGTATFATGVGTSPDGLGAGGPSVDQVAVQALKPNTRFPSLVVASGRLEGVNYSHISWSKARTPVPAERDARALFHKLFTAGPPGASGDELARLAAQRKSILDTVRDDLTRLEQRVGVNDRMLIEEHLDSIREVERQLDVGSSPSCAAPPEPGTNLSIPDKVRLQLKLIVLAFKCDLTRVASFQMFSRPDYVRFTWLGVDTPHHDVSHDTTPQGLLDQTRIVQWEVEQFAYLINELKSVPEGAGTLLDNSLVFFASEHEEGRTHENENMPVIVAGTAGGQIKTGRHVRYPMGTQYARIFVNILNIMGVPVTSFGTYGDSALPYFERW